MISQSSIHLPETVAATASLGANLGDRAFVIRPVIDRTVAGAFLIDAGDLRRPTRGRAPIAFARQVAMYITHVGLGLTMTAVGAAFGRDRTTVRHACRAIEDRRDDPAFDRTLDLLEGIVRGLERCAERNGDDDE